MAVLSAVFLARYFLPFLGPWPWWLLGAWMGGVLLDYSLLFMTSAAGVSAFRDCAERFSNGEDNAVRVGWQSHYGVPVFWTVIDEVPAEFEKRDTVFHLRLAPGQSAEARYQLHPVRRGQYDFGQLRLYARTVLGLVQRRFTIPAAQTIKVYPSFQYLRRYELMAETSRGSGAGIRRHRRLGHSMEFEQIKGYVPGDDSRTVNWKATARTGGLMVNHYSEEKSQQIYCLIDKGRAMKMPFGGMTLLDYAINSALVLLHIALRRQDRAGLLTFAETPGTFLAADRRSAQRQAILEALYHQQTRFLESDFERVYALVRRKIPQRSLLVLFTNFETVSGLERQLPYLRKMAAHHLLLVIFFENTGIRELVHDPPKDLKGIYTQVIAEQFVYEKKQIIRQLRQCGILTLWTPPQQLTVQTLNKYLEIKAIQAI
jgi:uncharacterized protein (DUF58 family)